MTHEIPPIIIILIKTASGHNDSICGSEVIRAFCFQVACQTGILATLKSMYLLIIAMFARWSRIKFH